MIWALILGRLKSALSASLSLFARYPWQTACFALALLCAALWGLWGRTKDDLAAAEAQNKAGRINVERLIAEKAAIEKRQAAITERIDDETKPARETALAAADRYARANRCVRSPSAVSAASGAGDGVPGPAAAAGSVEASPAAAELVAVSRADIDACTLNTTNLGLAVEWARAIGE